MSAWRAVCALLALVLFAAACGEENENSPGARDPETTPDSTSDSTPNSTSPPERKTTTPTTADDKVLLDEQFDGPLDPSRWSTCYWWTDTTCTNRTTGELQLYVPDNVTVNDGRLILTARREDATGDDGREHEYTSGMVSGARPSETMFSFQYGFVEARVRMPVGTGLWSALWMLPESREIHPEIDIFETVGEAVDVLEHHVHWAGPNGEDVETGRETHAPSASGWHIVGLRWQPDALTWYVDGKEVWEVTDPVAIPHEPMYLVANLAVGGAFTTDPTESTPFPASLEIDYIRVLELP